MINTLVKFDLQGITLRFPNLYYVSGDVLIADHPEEGYPVMFYRNGNPSPKDVEQALSQCGMKIGVKKQYKGVTYSELETI